MNWERRGAADQGHSLDDQIQELIGGEETDIETYWEGVEENLRQGKVRLIFVADNIPKTLRRLVEFINEKMNDVEVLAVEVKQYLGHEQKAMVPRVIGVTETTRKAKKAVSKRKWDEPSFFSTMAESEPDEVVAVARNILDWAHPRMTRVWWGEGTRLGSFVPVLNHNGRDHQLFALWTNGYIEIYFHWYQFKPPF
ncbi:MAG: hypothetical protein WA996_07100 [Candidatus Promineifilaceae bacterium]